jgi:mRNA interferase MazF
MARGDLILVELPQAIGPSGHEQTGNRPALVVHDDATSSVLPVIMIVPITGKVAANRYPHTIEIQPTPQNGLSLPSILLVFQLRAIDKSRIVRKLGVIDTAVLKQVTDEIKNLLGL